MAPLPCSTTCTPGGAGCREAFCPARGPGSAARCCGEGGSRTACPPNCSGVPARCRQNRKSEPEPPKCQDSARPVGQRLLFTLSVSGPAKRSTSGKLKRIRDKQEHPYLGAHLSLKPSSLVPLQRKERKAKSPGVSKTPKRGLSDSCYAPREGGDLLEF